MMRGWTRSGIIALAVGLFRSIVWGQAEPPQLNALGAVVMDADSGRILYAKNADMRLHPASTTKIMTALLLAERCKPEEAITAPQDVKSVKESSMHLEPGEWVTAGEMMYALLLRSANDGCHSVAVHISGSDAAFAELMNKRAKEIGCTNTTFVNPHGLTNPGHLTTPHDLALIAREAMKNPMFAQAAGTQKHVIQRSLNLKDTLMENHDKWLWLDPRAKGVKTGWTKPAGHCFVGYATDNGVNVITVVMKSEAWIHDQTAATNWAFENFEPKTVCHKGEPAGRIDVAGGTADSVPVVFGEDTKLLVLKRAGAGKFSLDEESTVQAPVVAGTVLQYVDFTDGLSTVKIPVVAASDVPKRTLASTIGSPGGIIGFVVLSAGALVVKKRSRRMSGGYSVRG